LGSITFAGRLASPAVATTLRHRIRTGIRGGQDQFVMAMAWSMSVVNTSL
jgi:hypothetical protein